MEQLKGLKQHTKTVEVSVFNQTHVPNISREMLDKN